MLFGFALITGLIAAFFAIEVRAGWLAVDSWNWRTLPTDAWFRTLWVGLLVNIGVAIGEETVFRGYLLTALKAVWGKRAGLTLMTVIFGLFHLPAYFEGGLRSGTLTLAILLASLFGLLFGFIYLRTRSLWLPVVLHFTWNFMETDVFNLTADSANQNLVGAITRYQGPLTLAEISFGNVILVEMLAFVLIAAGVWLWLTIRNKEPEEGGYE